MKLSNYGVILQKISLSDLELIRKWRNSDSVKQHMVFQDHITSEMQLNWFHKIDNPNNYYFLIIKDGTAIGLANIKDINYESKTGESGIFLCDSEHQGSFTGALATFVLLDFAFDTLNLQILKQSILSTNKNAISFNKKLGVEIVETKNGILTTKLEMNSYKYNNLKLLPILNK